MGGKRRGVDWQDMLLAVGIILLGVWVEHVAGWPGVIGYSGVVCLALAMLVARQEANKKG